MTEWNTNINEAPRDETDILVCVKNSTRGDSYSHEIVWWNDFREDWTSGESCGFNDDEILGWMYLPNFPILGEKHD